MKLRLLRSLLPLLLLLLLCCRGYSPTVIIDQTGHVITTWSWPTDKTVVIPVIVPDLIRELRATPAPGTPAPVYRP